MQLTGQEAAYIFSNSFFPGFLFLLDSLSAFIPGFQTSWLPAFLFFFVVQKHFPGFLTFLASSSRSSHDYHVLNTDSPIHWFIDLLVTVYCFTGYCPTLVPHSFLKRVPRFVLKITRSSLFYKRGSNIPSHFQVAKKRPPRSPKLTMPA